MWESRIPQGEAEHVCLLSGRSALYAPPDVLQPAYAGLGGIIVFPAGKWFGGFGDSAGAATTAARADACGLFWTLSCSVIGVMCMVQGAKYLFVQKRVKPPRRAIPVVQVVE
jgi:hypothetical protein